MQITVFGASGKVGQLVVKQLLEQDHSVVAFVHSHNPFTPDVRLQIVKGDVHDPEAVNRAVKGSQAVISTLGSWGTKEKNIVTSGTKNIISAMNQHGITRTVSLTGSDARVAGDKLGLLQRLSHFFIGLSPARKILHDGEQHIVLLQRSNLQWRVLRSPIMNQHGAAYCITTKRPKPWETVPRAAVADALVQLVQSSEYNGQAPFIRRG